LLITFVQFLTVSLLTWPGQFSASNPPYYLRKPAIPVIQWIPNIVLFFAVNILNNYAFGFNISVPVHIILRSGGSVTTLIVGWAWGRKYTRMQVLSVAMLTIGVIMAAISDSASKGKLTSSGTPTSMSKFLIGLTILFIAQVLSAIMGLYVQSTYAKYGGHWQENLFYSHFLSLPLFLPFASSLRHEFSRLLASRPLALNFTPWSGLIPPDTGSWLANLTSSSSSIRAPKPAVAIEVPTHMVTLALNAFTQFACIRGVNLLAARTTALGVSILLNMRKLISLFLSICLFGNHLPFGVLVGAVVVFLGGGVYAWDGGRSSSRDRRGKDGEKRRG
ncbi:MAG: golgi uridine diphosphate-N- acetylglucosamine transporter, partial [Icmadophila ericetorum]|nr:golgi uridine diphosphate-N- acetylglucosamine transporter [Icmadophila ericetorum]